MIETLVRHSWPGNVRELQHVIQRAVILSHGCTLELPPLDAPVRTPMRQPATKAETFDDAVRTHILEVLRKTNAAVADVRGAAARLGVKRSTLLSRMKKLGIVPPDVSTESS